MIIKTKFDIGQKVWVNHEPAPTEAEVWAIKIFSKNLIVYKFTNSRIAPENIVYATKEEAIQNYEKDRREIDYDYNTAHKKQAKS